MRGRQNAAGHEGPIADGFVVIGNAAGEHSESGFDIIEKEDAQAVTAEAVKQEVTVLLNVYTDKERRERKVNFLKGAWRSLKHGFKKNKDNAGSMTKEEVLASLAETFRSTDKLEEVANDAKLMKRIVKEMPEAQRNAALDKLYRYANDPKVLIMMIKARFGVIVADSSSESKKKLDSNTKKSLKGHDTLDWTAAGLVEVYKVYTHLPHSHLDLIKCLFHESNDKFSGAALSAPGGTAGIYFVDYKPGEETKLEEIQYSVEKKRFFGHCDNAADRRVGTIKMDMTTAHELGHIVDGTTGWKISGPGSTMRQVSKWEETENKPEQILAGMKDSLQTAPFESQHLSPEELAIVDKAALIYLKKSGQSFDKKWKSAAKYFAKIIEDVVAADHPLVNVADLKRKVIHKDASSDDDLFYHLWRGQAGNSSHYHYRDAMRGMKRPFWQGYFGESWFTFDKSAWNNKISCYQFRCPDEEFAETYASYHAAPAMGKRKGDMTPQPLLNWFLGAQYDNIIPSGQSPMRAPGSDGAAREQH